MKQTHHLNLLERQVGASSPVYQERSQAPAPLSQSFVAAVLYNRLKRAIAAHDPVAAGQARGALTRLALKKHDRLAKARRVAQRKTGLSADA